MRKALKRLGFELDSDEIADKRDLFRDGAVTIEARKRLADDSGSVRDWEARMWGRAAPVRGGTCRMSDKDCYIFHFVHMHREEL